MTNQQFAQRIMRVRNAVDGATPETIHQALLALEGIQPNCHVGRGDEMGESPEGQYLMLEWCAGQLLDLCEHKLWYAVNSWIHFADMWVKPIADGTLRKEAT